MTSPLAGAAIAQMEVNGVGTVVGTFVNPAGLILAKTVPIRRTGIFGDPGLGASSTWHGFAIDRAGIAFTEDISVVGDERMRIDLDALRAIGNGLAWAPASFFDQDGYPVPACSRGALARVEARLAYAGMWALVGHEIEFVLVGPDGSKLPSDLWAQYGLAGVLEHEGFIRDVTSAATAAGVGIEQFHPEYGRNQFEISLSPLSPVAAADQLILARIIISRVARDYGMRVSLSPVPFADGAGSGAHQHFSLMRGEMPLFSGAFGVGGMTAEGESAIAGVVAGLTEAQLVLCGSIVSGQRMKPGNWAGAFTCWGTENREAAVRFVHASHGNPYGANVEVKVVDPSANPYLASASILGLALAGIERGAVLPPEVTVDPKVLSDAELAEVGAARLSTDQAEQIALLDGSLLLRGILGDHAVNSLVAVRRYEHETYSHLDAVEIADAFRMSWSI